jgi:hypothetical protein
VFLVAATIVTCSLKPAVEAATVKVTALDRSNGELSSFVADGMTYTQADLIQPDLTAYASGNSNGISVPQGGAVPPRGQRAKLLTHDFRLDTGVFEIAVEPPAGTLTFPTPLVNGPGPDLVMFEYNGQDAFWIEVASTTRTYQPLQSSGGPAWPVSYDQYRRAAGTIHSLSQLENDAFSFVRSFGIGVIYVYGIAIDLDDFGIPSGGDVVQVNFGSATDTSRFDPALFMGINSSIPEPSTIGMLVVGAFLAFGAHRARQTGRYWHDEQ